MPAPADSTPGIELPGVAPRQSWPHAPPHHFTPSGLYIITAGTLHKARLFDTPAKLDLLRDTVFELSAAYHLKLQAWAFLSNHYHLVASFESATVTLSAFLRHLHRENCDPAQRERRNSREEGHASVLGYSTYL